MKRSPAPPLPPPEVRRRLREAAALTQAQLAERVGVTPEAVGAWESGREAPRGRKRDAYAKLLGTLADASPARQPEPAQAQAQASVPVFVAVGAGAAETAPSPPALTPAQAFDALYEFGAPALVRQTYLLTGRRELARESVERAFQLAWEHWPEVARDRDPVGWVRATAYEYALSPWHRFRRRHRQPEPPPADPADRTLLNALLTLPPPHRRTLVLYDGVGLDLPETAAETEASTPAAAGRLMRAREAV
ncbi:sigma-70 family RNA polymerase sigma factor, partial [Streptomyces sp. SID5910]|uniref:helix-turn-helix domain-containing protein n=1 Tax=Streptomyces sp. SID5910 TaxID=2690312 RepID=UPI0013686138|nr:helix-turn-helix domain-containing protein [Streptomyces sp. SID5910]